MTTLGDLLRQDGALALLAIGAVLGFLAALVFRPARGGEGFVPGSLRNVDSPPSAPSSGGVPAATFAAISAAVYKYRNENT